MNNQLRHLMATLFLGLAFFQFGISQTCVELGTPVGQLSPILKTVGGVCGPAAVTDGICDCPTGFVAVGYEGFEGNQWGAMVISQFSLRCRQLNSDGTLGATVNVTCANGNVAANTPDGPVDAPANEAIVGFEIRIGCAVDAVMGESKPMADIIAGLPNTTSNGMTAIGGTGGSPQPVMYAPNGNVIVGMETFIDPNTNLSGGVAWRYAPIVACPVPCSIDGISLGNISACDDNGTSNPADDTFTADVTVTFTSAPATGNLNLSGDGSATVGVGSLGAGTYTFNGVSMNADGGAINLTATFTADILCTLNNPNAGTAPGPCSAGPPPSCSIDGIAVSNISACDDNGTNNITGDDTFTADVTVTYSNAPNVGVLNLTGSGIASVAAASIGAGSHTFTGVTMTANGLPIGLSASFSAIPTCNSTVQNAGTAPASCSPLPPPIPTMSQWGLIIFALIIFTFSVVLGTQQQQALAMNGGNEQISSGWKLPFEKGLFFKALPFVYLGFALVFGAAMVLFGYELTSADLPGSLLSGLVIAYLAQFIMKSSGRKN